MLVSFYIVWETDVFQWTAWLSLLHSAFIFVQNDIIVKKKNITQYMAFPFLFYELMDNWLMYGKTGHVSRGTKEEERRQII